MLTRDRLTDDQWRAVRNTPHHVIIAVSATGGSIYDEMLERHAGLQGIVDAMHSTHPLIQELGSSSQIMQGQTEVREWYYSLPEPERTPARFRQQALDSLALALDAVAATGSRDDLMHYSELVLGVARRVAKAAREGDVLGIGGEVMSAGERDLIAQFEAMVKEKIG